MKKIQLAIWDFSLFVQGFVQAISYPEPTLHMHLESLKKGGRASYPKKATCIIALALPGRVPGYGARFTGLCWIGWCRH